MKIRAISYFILLLHFAPLYPAHASVVPQHVVCGITGTVVEKYTEKFIDGFMGQEHERTRHIVKLKIHSSQIIDPNGEGECGSPEQILTFEFRDWTDRFKYKKGQCISVLSQFSGSSTYNANFIYDIKKIDC